MTNPQPIYEHIVQACPPLKFNAPLSDLLNRGTARQGVADADGLLQTLRGKFSVEELIRTGVAADGGERVQLHPDLADSESAILPICTKPKTAPNNLIVKAGCVSATTLPILAALQDHDVQKRLSSGRPMLVALDVKDCAVLSALGLACTTATGLDTLGSQQLDTVCQTLGWTRGLQKDSSDSANEGCARVANSAKNIRQLVLVGWQPYSWLSSAHAAFASVRAHLIRLHHDLRIKMTPVMLWTPSEKQLASFASVASYGTWAELRSRLVESIAQDAKPLFIPVAAKDIPLEIAYKGLSCPNSLISTVDRGKSLRDLVQQVETRVIVPLVAEANRRSSASARQRLLLQAVLSDIFFRRTLPFLAELTNQSSTELSWASGPGVGRDLTPLLQMARELIRLSRGVSGPRRPRRK